MAEKSTQVMDIVTGFYNIIKDKYPVKKMLLYGSYARGEETEHSDIDIGVVIDLLDHSRRFEITADLFHSARRVNSLIEPKCIFWDEYKNHDSASILAEIIRTSKDTPL